MHTAPLKTCMIFPAYTPGFQMDGIGDYTSILVGIMREKGADVSVIASGRYSGSDPGVFKVGHGDNWGLVELIETLKIIKNSSFDVVHMQYTPVSYGFGVVFKLLPFLVRIISPGTLFVTTFHTLVGGKSVSKINALVLSLSSHRLVSTNDEITFLFRKWFPFCVKKLHQIPIASNVEVHDVDPAQAREEICARYGIDNTAVLIGNFGFVYGGKGIEDLVAALKKLETDEPRYYVMFIGALRKDQQEYRSHIKELIRMHNLEKYVIWAGELHGKDLAAHLKACDMYVAPYSDGISTRRGSLMAAMAYGLPVVSTYPRAGTGYFKQNKNVLLVRPGDPVGLYEAIKSLASDELLKSALSKGVLELSGEFNWNTITEKTQRVYSGKEQSVAAVKKVRMTLPEMIRYIMKEGIESVEYVVLRLAAAFIISERRDWNVRPASRKILLIQLNSIGDAVMSTPALKALKDIPGKNEIHVLSASSTSPVFRVNPSVKKVYELERTSWRSMLVRPKALKKAVGVIRGIRSEKFDICVDLTGTASGIVPTLLSGAGRKFGPLVGVRSGIFRGDTRSFYGEAVVQGSEHIIDRYLELVSPLGASREHKKEEFPLSSPKRQIAFKFMRDNGIKEGNFAVIHPGAKWPPKRWPRENFAALVRMLRERAGLSCVLVGGGDDKGLLSDIKARSGKEDVIIASDLDIENAALIISLARVFVGNDSGPAHIAAAVGVPAVVLFGPTDPAKSAPPGENVIILHDRISCWPCTLYFRRDRCEIGANKCLEGIMPETVFTAVEEFIRSDDKK